MTKPFESWIDRQTREAMERGEFDDLPGQGRPIDLSDTSDDWWIKATIKRENLDAVLPGPLALRREVEDIAEAVADAGAGPPPPPAAGGRERCEALNDRVREHYARPSRGPLIPVRLVDVDAEVRAWRERGRPG